MEKLLPRSLGALLLIAMLMFCLINSGIALMILFGVFFGVTAWETRKLLKTEGKKVITLPALIFSVSFPLIYGYTENGAYAASLYLISVAVTMIAQIIITRENMSDAIHCLRPFIYPILPECALLALYTGFPDGIGKTLFCASILLPKIGDMFAYFGGSLFGKHLLAPLLSPHKTVEGAAFSVFGSILMGFGLFYLQRVWGGAVSLTVLLSYGLVCGIAGIFGDLFASCIKRSAGIKDFSNLLPGHGGLTDVLDSTFLCALIILGVSFLVYY